MFKTVLFDIDGVMLSEERYFDASALTVYEMLTSPDFLCIPAAGPKFVTTPKESDITTIRKNVFHDDQVLESLKNVGVNANWDMVYLTFVAELVALTNQARSSHPSVDAVFHDALHAGWTSDALQKLGRAVRNHQPDIQVTWSGYQPMFQGATSRDALFTIAKSALQSFGAAAGDDKALWNLCQETFQAWYLGDSYSGKTTGKTGFLASEYPIVDPEKFHAFLTTLQASGVQLGIATGRPNIETRVPLEHFGWWSCFEPKYVTTASEVLEAEGELPSARPLSKPHPYSYLRSLKGIANPKQLLETTLPLQDIRGEVLIIGDSIADCLAAKRLGASFAAVLTGLEGKLARPKFEQLDADYIFDDVLDAQQLFA